MLVGSCMCVHCARMCGWEALLWLSVSPCVRLGTTVGVWRYASCGHASGCPVGHSAHACVLRTRAWVRMYTHGPHCARTHRKAPPR